MAAAAHTRAGPAPVRVAGRKNLLQLIELRWLAVAGQFATILAVELLLEPRLPLGHMLALLGALSFFNLACWMRSQLEVPVSDAELFAGLVVDAVALTGQLYLSGGISNPFVYLFLLQVAVASVLLRPAYIWAMVGVTALCFMLLSRWHLPLALGGLPAATLSAHYVGGLLLCFALNAALLVIFIGRIQRNLRQRDAHLADLRQRAAEEEHIVRMGLLATGAAHELGTPLATLSVILGDWSRMAPFAADPELREEIDEMQLQLARCKTIVSGILQSAGEARGEAPVHTRLHDFLDTLAGEWHTTRSGHALRFAIVDLEDRAIISDTALKQMICNVLDNAMEAAPEQPITFTAAGGEDDTLVLRIEDEGPGFLPGMIEHLGEPYRSSKGKPGRGLGLFLSVNVARVLGGHVHAANRPEGGALVTISLPLAALEPSSAASAAGQAPA